MDVGDDDDDDGDKSASVMVMMLLMLFMWVMFWLSPLLLCFFSLLLLLLLLLLLALAMLRLMFLMLLVFNVNDCHYHYRSLHSLKLTVRPKKWMVGILLSYWVSAYFQGLWLLVSGRVYHCSAKAHRMHLISSSGWDESVPLDGFLWNITITITLREHLT